VKLINQIFFATHFFAVAEAVRFAEQHGVDATKIPAALAGGRADSRIMQEFMAKFARRDFSPTGRIDNMLKDLETEPLVGQRPVAAIAGLAFLATAVATYVLTNRDFDTIVTGAVRQPGDSGYLVTASYENLRNLAELVFTDYLYAFEITSVLLVIALGRRFLRSSGPVRRQMVPVLAGAAAILLQSASWILFSSGTSLELLEIVRGAFKSAYVGYFAFAALAGRGYMTEGFALALDFALRDFGLHRVEANVQPDNVRSLALVERLGFTREGYSRRYVKIAGRWRDHVRYAMLAEDWRKLRGDVRRRLLAARAA
jgi:hypothetical protein